MSEPVRAHSRRTVPGRRALRETSRDRVGAILVSKRIGVEEHVDPVSVTWRECYVSHRISSGSVVADASVT